MPSTISLAAPPGGGRNAPRERDGYGPELDVGILVPLLACASGARWYGVSGRAARPEATR